MPDFERHSSRPPRREFQEKRDFHSRRDPREEFQERRPPRNLTPPTDKDKEKEREKDKLKDEKPLPPSRARKIAVFGGSFDPIHNGHIQIASLILSQNLADEVLFIPALLPPHKDGQTLASPEDRLEMIRLAIQDYIDKIKKQAEKSSANITVAQKKNPEFSYSDIELQRTGRKSYTIETMEILSKVYSDYDLCFVMGMDSLRILPTWHKATELVTKTDFIIYPRPGVKPLSFLELERVFGTGGATGASVTISAGRRSTSAMLSMRRCASS